LGPPLRAHRARIWPTPATGVEVRAVKTIHVEGDFERTGELGRSSWPEISAGNLAFIAGTCSRRWALLVVDSNCSEKVSTADVINLSRKGHTSRVTWDKISG